MMTREMQDALATVSYLLENVKKFDMEAKRYEGFGFLLLALVKKAHDSAEHVCWQQALPEQEVLAEEQLEAARRIGQFAINVYPASWRLSLPSISKSLGVPEQDIVLVHFSDLPDQGHCPKFALFLDHPTRSLVLAVRGTFSLKDVVLDIVCEEAAFLNGHAHSGILQGAARVLERVGLLLTSTLRLHPGYSLTLTGDDCSQLPTRLLITFHPLKLPGAVYCRSTGRRRPFSPVVQLIVTTECCFYWSV